MQKTKAGKSIDKSFASFDSRKEMNAKKTKGKLIDKAYASYDSGIN